MFMTGLTIMGCIFLVARLLGFGGSENSGSYGFKNGKSSCHHH